MGSSSSPSDSLNGLKFGQKIYFEDVGFGAPTKSGGGSSSSSGAGGGSGGKPSPTKKGRSGVVQARCQVEGCKVDLSDAKAYYSRHKVCGMHSKSPVVTVAGLEQRFCQQCSRSASFFLPLFLILKYSIYVYVSTCLHIERFVIIIWSCLLVR